jgi:SAM-dependent methyltransferase
VIVLYLNQRLHHGPLRSYSDIAIFFLPVSAHLVRLCSVCSADRVLDVACGTGNTAITANKLGGGAKVTGIDFTPELLSQAKAEASLAEAKDIEWKEGNVEDLPFDDNSFDVVLSSFGHMFAPRPEVAIHEMLRVTKTRGRIGFATWPAELANGRLYEAIEKHIPSTLNNPPSPMQWGIPKVIQERLASNVNKIHFDRGLVNVPLLSLNHYWNRSITKSGTMIQVIQTLKETQKIESLRIGYG